MLLIETYLAESPGKGLGLYSKNFIPKDTIIWKFVEGFDIRVHKDQYHLLSDLQKKHIDTYFWREGDYLYSSCDNSNFQNHSSNPNSVCCEHDKMIAARDINPGEEILADYKSFDDDFESYKDGMI
jgi:SET domain-containing protein